jgi:hypothetical protein
MSTPNTDGAGVLDPGGASWHTSSYSQDGGECVEAAFLPDGGVALRHSKHPGGSVLRYTRPEWHAFVRGVKRGEFDLA